MRRKGRFLAGLVLLLALIPIWSLFSTQVLQRQAVESTPEATFADNNSLVLQLGDSLRLEFMDNFTKAKIELTEAPLSSSAYVRIFDQNNQWRAGEYTEMRDQTPVAPDDAANPPSDADENEVVPDEVTDDDTGTGDDEKAEDAEDLTPPVVAPPVIEHVFPHAPTSYIVTLEPGYTIEIESPEAQFYSTLDHSLAKAFAPDSTRAQYVVTAGGLRKTAWSEAEADEQLYQLLKSYLTQMIASYQANVPDEILHNKTLDLAAKTRVLAAYNELRKADQTPYRDFITAIMQGGIPQLTYHGDLQYPLGADIDFLTLVTAFDAEDGELDPETIALETDLDWQKDGEYTVTFSVCDSDDNLGTLSVVITVGQPQTEFPPLEPLPDPGLSDEDNITDPTPEQPDAGLQGGGTNSAPAPSETVADTTDRSPRPWTPFPSNAQATITDPADDPADNAPAEETAPQPSHNQSQVATNQPTASTETSPTPAKSGLPWTRIILIALGGIFLFALIRFIFDHYVR